MGHRCYCIRRIHRIHKHLHRLIISFLLLSSTHMRFSAEAKRNPFRDAVSKASEPVEPAKKEGVEEARVAWPMVGSQPPRCERICRKCDRCEPVQVPAVPQDKKTVGHYFSTSVAFRGDYSSNYKPVSWKCKCGDLIFNP